MIEEKKGNTSEGIKEIHTETNYLPNIEYFCFLSMGDKILIEVNENYQKQTLRNRCYILGANKVDILTVPVNKGTGKVKTKDIKVDYSQKWQSLHIRAIKSAYGKAPFFQYFAPYFFQILTQNHKFLIDLNTDLLTLCLKLLKWKKELIFTNDYLIRCDNISISDLSTYIPRQNAKEAPDKFQIPAYNQMFGKEFVPNLSIIDLLFCQGTSSSKIISEAVTR